MEWRLIDSAPKDGTSILVWDGKFVERVAWKWIDTRKLIGCWAIQGGEGDVAFSDYGDTRADVDGPTHWMPLPEPPQ